MSRFSTACKAFWHILWNKQLAQAWQQISVEEAPSEAPPSPAAAGISADAVYSLVLLQRSGRLVDFLEEDVAGYSDEQIGAAVRQIHEKCGKVLEDNFAVGPIMTEPEGTTVEVQPGFDPSTVRLIGNVRGEPPFKGVLRHPGWKVGKVDFPERSPSMDPAVIAPAEVEL